MRPVDDVWDSLQDDSNAVPLTSAQKAELDSRLTAYEEDRNPGRPAADVLADVRCRL